MFKKLTECEQLVMKVVWDADGEYGLMDIMDRVNNRYHKNWKPQTVSTFLARLVQKGYLQHYRQGRVFYYKILVPFAEYRKQITGEFIDLWFCGSSYDFLHEELAVRALETLVSICESQEQCTVCPLYDPDETDTACMLSNSVRGSLSVNARETLNNIKRKSLESKKYSK